MMRSKEQEQLQAEFKRQLSEFVETLKVHISTADDQWTVKGFIDVFRNIYTISADTKIVSKILEIHFELKSIVSVIGDFQFFAQEKWEISSDLQGSSNTANIGSITRIADILGGNGVFKYLGEKWFDDYWINYGKIQMTMPDGAVKKITTLKNYLVYRGQDPKLANSTPRKPARKNRRAQQ